MAINRPPVRSSSERDAAERWLCPTLVKCPGSNIRPVSEVNVCEVVPKERRLVRKHLSESSVSMLYLNVNGLDRVSQLYRSGLLKLFESNDAPFFAETHGKTSELVFHTDGFEVVHKNRKLAKGGGVSIYLSAISTVPRICCAYVYSRRKMVLSFMQYVFIFHQKTPQEQSMTPQFPRKATAFLQCFLLFHGFFLR